MRPFGDFREHRAKSNRETRRNPPVDKPSSKSDTVPLSRAPRKAHREKHGLQAYKKKIKKRKSLYWKSMILSDN